MNATDKEYARNAWRDSQRRRARRTLSNYEPATKDINSELASNEERYDEDAVAELEPGQHGPISKGADLARLLQEQQQSACATSYYSRQFLDEEATQSLPESVVNDIEQVLTIDFAALEKSLSLLPAHELLGIEEEFLPNLGISSSLSRHTPSGSQQPGLHSAATPHAENVSARHKNEADLPAEAKAQRDTDSSSQLRSESKNSMSRRQAAEAGAPAEVDSTIAKASLLGEAAETDTADRAFEELMLSASPKTQKDTRTSKPGYYQAVAQETASKSLEGDEPLNDRRKLANLTDGGQANVDDLESWLDSL